MRLDPVDVLVVGAGTSGVPAAVSAARCGADVLLLERQPIVGGTITGSYVAMPCGGPRTGLYQAMLERLTNDHQLTGGPNWFLPSSWLDVMLRTLKAEPNLRVVCGAEVGSPIVEDRQGTPTVAGVVVRQKDGGECEVRAPVVIDATGDGSLASAAGCESLYGRDAKSDFDEPHAQDAGDDVVQECTWMYISQKLGDRPAFDMMQLENVRRGVLVSGLGWFHANPGECLRRDPGIHLHWGCAVRCRDTRDPMALAEAQREALTAMERDLALLREGGYAVHLAPRLGVRETRRIVGEHVITENDLRSGELPSDTIAIGTYGLDIWGGQLSRDESRVPAYGIPYRAILPKGVDGLILAGKSISGTHIAMSGYRVQPILSSAGQAAGVAAALSAQLQIPPQQLDASRIRDVLTQPEHGVQLGG